MNLILLIFILLAAIFLLNRILNRVDRKKLTSKKNYQRIKGKKLFFYERGQGEDLIVLLSGSGVACPFTDMQQLYFSEIGQKSKLLIIDRLGSGLSDDTSEERSIDNISNEIMSLERIKENTGRIFIAGHSLACLIAMRVSQMYGDKISGILLLDPPSLTYVTKFKDPLPKFLLYFFKYSRIFGLVRVYSLLKRLFLKLSRRKAEFEHLEEICLNKNYFSCAMINERLRIREYGTTILENLEVTSKAVMLTSNNKFSQWQDSEYSIFRNLELNKINTKNHFIHHYEVDLITRELEKLLESEEA